MRCVCFPLVSLFCSNLLVFSVVKKPEVKKYLGVPIVPPPPPSTKPSLPFFEQVKKYAEAAAQKQLQSQKQQQSLSSPTELPYTPTSQRRPSSSVLNKRIKSLEKEVKARKSGKRGKKMWCRGKLREDVSLNIMIFFAILMLHFSELHIKWKRLLFINNLRNTFRYGKWLRSELKRAIKFWEKWRIYELTQSYIIRYSCSFANLTVLGSGIYASLYLYFLADSKIQGFI